MDYELWKDLQQRRMDEAASYRMQHRARRRVRCPRRAVRLLTIGGAVAVAIGVGGVLVTVTGTG